MTYEQLVALADRVKGLQAERRYTEALPGARALLEQLYCRAAPGFFERNSFLRGG